MKHTEYPWIEPARAGILGYDKTIDEVKRIFEYLESINPRKIEGIAQYVRHQVYALGLNGGFEGLQKQAKHAAEIEQKKIDHIPDPFTMESAEDYAERLRKWRTYFAIRALSISAEERVDEVLGSVNARLRPSLAPERVPAIFFDNKGELIKEIGEATPLDQLLDIIAFTENGTPSKFETEIRKFSKSVLKAMRRAAQAYLIETLVSTDKNFIEIGRQYFTSADFNEILQKSPGALSEGKIGRKAAGMLLANAVLKTNMPDFDQQFAEENGIRPNILKEITTNYLEENVSYFLGSKILKDFIKDNRDKLSFLTIAKYFDEEDIGSEEEYHQKVEDAINKAEFSPHILRQLSRFHDQLQREVKGNPIIVRSSSALEDRLGASFAGMYESHIVAGSSFDEFISAIKKIYISVFSRKVIRYRQEKKYRDFNEGMGLLVQKLNGSWYGDYFLPDIAGVALSQAPQSPGPDPSKGMMTIVTGLGEQVVDKGGKIIWFDKPGYSYRTNNGRAYTQEVCHVIDRNTGATLKLPPEQVFGGPKANSLRTTIQDIFEDQAGLIPATNRLDCSQHPVATFQGLTRGRLPAFPLLMQYITKKLEHALGYKVDIEFTARNEKDKYKVRIVQCRPQNIAQNLQPAFVPEKVPESAILLKTKESLSSGHADNVRYMLYISPDVYGCDNENQLSHDEMNQVHKYVSEINKKMKEKDYLIVAPGRWGNNKESELGIHALASDYDNAAAIVELVGKGHWKGIDPSAGTHDYQLIVEKGIAVFSVDLNSEGSLMNSETLEEAPNRIHEITDAEIPEKFSRWIKVIDAEDLGEEEGGLAEGTAGGTGAVAEGGTVKGRPLAPPVNKKSELRFNVAMNNNCKGCGHTEAAVYISPKNSNLPEIEQIQ